MVDKIIKQRKVLFCTILIALTILSIFSFVLSGYSTINQTEEVDNLEQMPRIIMDLPQELVENETIIEEIPLIIEPIEETIIEDQIETIPIKKEPIKEKEPEEDIPAPIGLITPDFTTMAIPTQGIPILNSTFGTNYTNENLTVYNQSTYDADGDNVTNKVLWLRNGRSYPAIPEFIGYDNTVLNVPFENFTSNSDKLKDFSKNSFSMSEVSTAVWNATVGFDGYGGYDLTPNGYLEVSSIQLPNDHLTDQVTVEMWVNPDTLGSGNYVGLVNHIFGLNEGFLVALYNGDQKEIYFHVGCPGGNRYSNTNDDALTTGQWQHIVAVYNGTANPGDLKVYVNGTERTLAAIGGAGTGDITSLSSLNTLRLGFYSTAFNGKMDNVKIYDYAVDANQVQTLYNRGMSKIYEQQTENQDIWQACITPNDGTSDGATNCSNTLTIQNSLPTQDTPLLNSTSGTNTSDENLTVYPQSTNDIDEDSIKNIINWKKDSNSITLLNMPFEGGSTSSYTKDYSENGNDGSVRNANYQATGGYDGKGAYSFGPTASNISVGDIDLPTDFTFVAWVKRSTLDLYARLFSKRGTNHNIDTQIMSPGCKLRFYIYQGGNYGDVQSSTGLCDDTWHHIALVRNTSQSKLHIYIDGILENSTTDNTVGSSIVNNNPLMIGGRNDNLDYDWNGSIDDVLIFNYSLSTEQINALYNNRTDLIVSQEISDSDVWQACITPNDGNEDGATNCSNSLTISDPVVNNLPTQGIPLLNSTTGNNQTTDNLTVYNQSTYDADSNPVKNIINWKKDDASITLLNMPFEGGSNDTWTKDYSENQNHASNSGTVTFNSSGGFDGKGAYQFSGSNNYLNPGSNVLPDQYPYSVVLRFKHTSTASNYGVFQLTNGTTKPNGGINLHMSHWSGDYWYVSTGDADGGDAWSLNPPSILASNDVWYHIAIVVEGELDDDITVYVNSTNIPEDRTDHWATSTALNAIGGANTIHTTNSLPGSIDEFQVYNRALSAEQVNTLYNDRPDIIVSQETSKGDTWHACITPNDGTGDGTTNCSNNLTILNTIPTQGIPILNSSTGNNLTTENITVYNQLTFDPDNDNIINKILWLRNERSYPAIPEFIGYDNTLLHVPFENYTSDSDKLKDYSKNNFTISENAPVTWNSTLGHDGYGAYDLTGGYLTVSNIQLPNDHLTNQVTVEMWVNPDSLGSGNYVGLVNHISGLNEGFLVGLYSGDQKEIYFHVGCPGGNRYTNTNDGALTTGRWQHIIAVYNGSVSPGDLKVYVNGSLRSISAIGGSGTGDITSLSSLNTVRLGFYSTAFNGKMDNVKIYDYAVDANQVQTLYNNGMNKIYEQQTEVNDVWQACITPNDGTVEGATNCSNTLTILSTPPQIDSILINSTSGLNTSDDNLTLFTTTSDADADDIIEFIEWFKNSQLIYNYSKNIIQPQLTSTLFMPFDDSNQNNATFANDYSQYNNDGTVVNAIFNATAGHDGNGAYQFNESAYIRLPDNTFDSDTEGTIAMWIYPKAYHDTIFSLAVSGTPLFNIQAPRLGSNCQNTDNDCIMFSRYVSGASRNTMHSSLEININAWNHIAIAVNSSGTRFIINGVEDPNIYEQHNTLSSAAWFDDFSAITSNYAIGADIRATVESPFNGTIDDVRVYNFSITTSEAKALYANRSKLILSSETSTNDVWQACNTPFDGSQFGTRNCSNNLTIQNSAPVVTFIKLNATSIENITTDNLNLYYSVTDAEGNNIINYTSWLRNGRSYPATPYGMGHNNKILSMPFENYTDQYDIDNDFSNTNTEPNVDGPTWNATGGYDEYGSYYFDGFDNITLGDFDLPRKFSISTWINPENVSTGSSQILIY
ncbi:LamG domain-containing protein, partial [Nanoarchaeota archaeon]